VIIVDETVLNVVVPTSRPTSRPSRSRSSPAARLVNVMASTRRMSRSPCSARQAIRRVSTRVLPEPARARMHRGFVGSVTAASWAGSSPSSNESVTIASRYRWLR
jgi:hypothetical protein